MKTEIEEIERQMEPLRKRLYELRAKETADANAHLLGKCYKYRNSYGNRSESWWLYARVVKAGESVLMDKFERTSINQFEATIARWGAPSLDSYKEITRREYDAARRKFLRGLEEALKP